jgi:hypothetical protein
MSKNLIEVIDILSDDQKMKIAKAVYQEEYRKIVSQELSSMKSQIFENIAKLLIPLAVENVMPELEKLVLNKAAEISNNAILWKVFENKETFQKVQVILEDKVRGFTNDEIVNFEALIIECAKKTIKNSLRFENE